MGDTVPQQLRLFVQATRYVVDIDRKPSVPSPTATPMTKAEATHTLSLGAVGVPLQAVALQFPMRHPGVGTVVVGASNPREIEENVAAATFPVPDEIWAEVEERMRHRA